MIDRDRFDPQPRITRPRDQGVIDAPRELLQQPTGWDRTNRNGAAPLVVRPGAGSRFTAGGRPRDDAPVTVPAGLVIQVLPPQWGRAPGRPAEPLGEPAGFVAEWHARRGKVAGKCAGKRVGRGGAA